MTPSAGAHTVPPMPSSPPSSRDAIRDLMMRYVRHSDRGEYDAVGAMFEHGPFASSGGLALSGAALAASRKRYIREHNGRPGTRQLTINVMIDVGENAASARARSYYLLLQATPTLPLQLIAAGRYHDAFERVAGAWRFRSRTIHLDHEGEIDQHVAPISIALHQ